MARVSPVARTLLSSLALWGLAGATGAPVAPEPAQTVLRARVIATGLQGAQGLRQVGRFHAGGPFSANPEFLLQTQPGRVLDPERVLVAVNGPAAPGGAVLSIDPQAAAAGRPLALQDLAGLLAQRAGGAAPVQLYSAPSPATLNRLHNSGARTAAFAAVDGPRYLSINNAFGRPWIANAPAGLQGPGTESVVDPDGAPLANAPSDEAGGVFVGALTPRSSVPRAVRSGGFASWFNRQPSGQLTPGAIDRGAYGTALLGASPDGSGFAVFAVVTGAGAIVQVHVQDGVDGLAPPGTVEVGERDPGVIGIAFKWNPQRVLYVADARRDRIALLTLVDDRRHFRVERSAYIASPWLREPVDLAAATPEIASPRFASHTTLAGGSDLYVANRGDGSLLRLSQDGRVLARASLELPDGSRLGAASLRSLAVSGDGQRLWVIAERAGGAASLLEVDAFDAQPGRAAGAIASTTAASVDGPAAAAAGAHLFSTTFTADTGLGRLHNASSCLACHPGPGGASASEEHFARRAARLDPRSGRLVPIDGQSSVIAPRRSRPAGGGEDQPAALPPLANVVSLRMPLGLTVAARIADIDDATIEAQAVSKGDGIKGRVHRVVDPNGIRRVGRFGWKADVATLDEMVAQALANEMGVAHGLGAPAMASSISAFLLTLGSPPPPLPSALARADANAVTPVTGAQR